MDSQQFVKERVLHTGSFHSSILPISSKVAIMIFLFLGLEVVRPEKNQNPLRVKTIFPLEVCLEKKPRQSEHKAVCGFFFPQKEE